MASEDSGGGLVAKTVLYAMAAVASVFERAWHGLMKDGHLAAAGRQGIDELGAALKAFPDSIQQHEYGSLFDPMPSDVSNARKAHETVFGHSVRGVHGYLPSPGDIAKDRGLEGEERGQHHEHERSNGRERGHEHEM